MVCNSNNQIYSHIAVVLILILLEYGLQPYEDYTTPAWAVES